MRVRPILFSGPMVRALIDGRKKQTRRVLSRITSEPQGRWRFGNANSAVIYGSAHELATRGHECEYMPYAVGDVLWVRETWCPANSDDGPVLLTRADLGRRYLTHESYPVEYERYPAGRSPWCAWAGDVEGGTTKDWRPGIHMPRWASRLTLAVTGVKVERLQDISEADAMAEGATSKPCPDQWRKDAIGWSMDWPEQEPAEGWQYVCLHSARFAFGNLWNSINGEDAWAANPWVVAVSFTVHQQNVDAYLAREREAA